MTDHIADLAALEQKFKEKAHECAQLRDQNAWLQQRRDIDIVALNETTKELSDLNKRFEALSRAFALGVDAFVTTQEALREVEFGSCDGCGVGRYCFACGGGTETGHNPDCSVGRTLKQLTND